MEHDLLTGKILLIILRESDVDVLLLTGFHTDDLILKAGNKAAGAQLQLVALPLAAGKGNAIIKAFKVNHGSVALFGGTIDRDKARIALRHFVQALIHIFVADVDLFLRCADSLILAEFDIGIDRNGRLKGEAVLCHIADHLHLGIADGVKFFTLHRVRVCRRERLVHRITVENLRAIQLLDHLAGGFAGAKAGNADLSARLGVGLGNSGLKLLSANLDLERDSALLQLFHILDSHVSISSV